MFGFTFPKQSRITATAVPTLGFLLATLVSLPAQQAPPPPPSYVVDVISGGKRESKTFSSPDQSTGESNGQPAQSH